MSVEIYEICELCGKKFKLSKDDVIWHYSPEDDTVLEKEVYGIDTEGYPHYHLRMPVPICLQCMRKKREN